MSRSENYTKKKENLRTVGEKTALKGGSGKGSYLVTSQNPVMLTGGGKKEGKKKRERDRFRRDRM